MKNWQKNWLYILIILASIHYLRDTLQDLEIQSFLTSTFVKAGHSMAFQANPPSSFKIYWAIFNTYTIAISEIIFATTCLYRNKFGKLGYSTLVVAVIFLIVWLFSLFFLK